jgi:hypothetical protein
LVLKPDDIFALSNRSSANLAKGNLFPADEDIERVLQLEPNNAFAINLKRAINSNFQQRVIGGFLGLFTGGSGGGGGDNQANDTNEFMRKQEWLRQQRE